MTDAKKKFFIDRKQFAIIYEALKGLFEPDTSTDEEGFVKYKDPKQNDRTIADQLRPLIDPQLTKDHVRRVREEFHGFLHVERASRAGNEFLERLKHLEQSIEMQAAKHEAVRKRLDALEDQPVGNGLTVEAIHNEMLLRLKPLLNRLDALEKEPQAVLSEGDNGLTAEHIHTHLMRVLNPIVARLEKMEEARPSREPTANMSVRITELANTVGDLTVKMNHLNDRMTELANPTMTARELLKAKYQRPPRQK